MRLLHFDASGRLILTNFRGKPIPPYAILSHRWGDSEILIENVLDGNYKEKGEGYRKLQFCAKQAAQDKLQYFWIDTCCIDRWDHDERSRAINSMFQWYRNAARCYVFLSDVLLSATADTPQRSDWETSFRNSEWFTRGWTLQELIAPVTVEFFSCEGQRIGDKVSLDHLLHDITQIPLAALHNCALDQFSISERIQWVKTRRTTEDEDIVYCLLGLLGISMSTTYGEGKQSALRRLQAEVEEAGSSAPSIIPFSRNQSFVGRELQLTELEAKLFSNKQTTTTLAIVGSGGTGKSQLALEAAYMTKQNCRNCSVFWIDASDRDSLYRSYTKIAQKLSIPGCDDDQVDTKQVIERCVATISTRQCLLIFDNVERTTAWLSSLPTTEATSTDLAEFLPHSKLCSVIFTTTESNIAEALAPQHVTVLQELTPDTALRMLQNRVATPFSNTEQHAAMQLLKELLYSPLAIAQAAACINASSVSVQQYQAQLVQHKDAALGYDDNLFEDKQRECGLRKTVAATLSLSINQVYNSDHIAIDYLFISACVNRRDISLDLLETASLRAREDAVKTLDKYALVTRRPAESALDIHRLVHDALRSRLQAQGQLQQWTQRTITKLVEVFPNDDHSRSKWRRLLPHALFTLSHSQTEDSDEERLDLAWKCAKSLYSDGMYKEAGKLFFEVMQTQKRVLGKEHPSTLKSMANLASTYWNQGRWSEAEEIFVEAIQTQRRVLGKEHPDTLNSMANLATTYWNQRRRGEAEELLIQVMQMRKRVSGEEHPETLASIANLALTYSNQGRWGDAEELQVQVLQTQKRLLGEEHPDTLKSVANLAVTYSNQGRWGEAEELEMQVVQTRTRVLGKEHPDTLNSMASLASTYWNQGRWGEAEQLEVQVVETRKRVLGEGHHSTLTSMGNLAFTLHSQARREEALALMETCFQLRQEVFGEKHHDTQSSLETLHTWRAECSSEEL
ncbi:uncharacterized protein yc1106_04126 [Curvularia clavata]|uniref:AAA+ ATPase domain-containing protein n=1 Tax=Curvularia clavata TaxID=95742 RepID=A0A9Q9DRP0_CURCL|nr:uncharacterized protein yc1106_04126 [Curvularia clavata]